MGHLVENGEGNDEEYDGADEGHEDEARHHCEHPLQVPVQLRFEHGSVYDKEIRVIHGQVC